MSSVTSQPQGPRSTSGGRHDEVFNHSAQSDIFNPSIVEGSCLANDLTYLEFISDVDKDPSVVQVEQRLVDADGYSSPLSPSAQGNNFLTPEYSSENQYSDPSVSNTPGWDDDWLINDTTVVPVETAASMQDPFKSIGSTSMNQATTGAKDFQDPIALVETNAANLPLQLLSPQLTSTPSPATQQLQTFTMGHTSTVSAPVIQRWTQSKESPSAGLRVDSHRATANSGSSSASLQASPSEALNPAPSPILMVSTYNRGDSPARSGFRQARSSGKRSRTSQSSNLLAPSNQYSSEDEEALGQTQNSQPPVGVIRTEDGTWLAGSAGGQAGLDPTARGNIYVLSPKQSEEKRQVEEKNAEVESWLEKSETGSEVGHEDEKLGPTRGRHSTRPKARAHSTGARVDTLSLAVKSDSGIPGPGALLDEDSDAAYTDDSASSESENDAVSSPPAEVDLQTHADDSYFPKIEHVAPDEEEPLPRQFIRAQPWQDSIRGPVLRDTALQPMTSNAAIHKYDQLAAKIETASRAATWGTRRRLSDTDIQSIVSGQCVRKLSLAQKTRERGTTIVRQASRLIPRRSSSNSKRREAEATRDPFGTESVQKKRTDTLSSFKPLQRIPSIGKAPKSPTLNTGSALVAMAGQIKAVGRSTSATPDTGTFPNGRWKALKRQRSKSEIPRTKASGTPGLAELMTNHGGPPIPVLVSPFHERRSAHQSPRKLSAENEDDRVEEREEEKDEEVEDEEKEESSTSRGVKIDLKVKIDNIIPNLDGFRAHLIQLNPRIEPFLADRIVQEQVRRYKKLVENKVKHTHAVKSLKKCSSEGFCYELGGEAKELPPRTSSKDPDATCAQFQVSGTGDSDGEANTFAEGVVTAALFPVGIPLPPVKKLPAEFECSLCFQVKRFQKPSDWTKHVHEDVQPFTCTFPNCPDGRSFKRKADWVRHENEKHRHLEWWQCNMPECSHKCYRKDNFVQHLVREHKKREPKREPKVKQRGSTGTQKATDADSVAAWHTRLQDEEIDEVWRLVDTCHYETRKKPKEEVCKFCGNLCNSWKKLTVHLAKHMEQIAMPVLELVKRREVSPDTIISPVERSHRRQQAHTKPASPESVKREPNGLSPYAMNVTLQQGGLQATTQSPGAYSQDSHITHSMQNSPSFSHTPTSGYGPPLVTQPPEMDQFVRMHHLPPDMSYGPYQSVQQSSSSFTPVNHSGTAASTYPPPYNVVRRPPQQMALNTPRSHPGLVQVEAAYNPQPSQLPLYSSPTDHGPYPAPYEIAMNTMQGYGPGTMAYDQNGIPTEMPIPQNVLYDSPQGPPFVANRPDSQSYSYSPQ